ARKNYRVVVAVQGSWINGTGPNQLSINARGGEAGSFIQVSVQPTPSTVLNGPDSAGFEAAEAGLGMPYGVAVDQQTHQAYIADRFHDSVVQFDLNAMSIDGGIPGVDGDSAAGDGGTTGVRMNAKLNQVVALSEGVEQGLRGSIGVIDLDQLSLKVIPLIYAGQLVHSDFIAVDPNNNVAAFAALYAGGKSAYFVDLNTGKLTRVDQSLDLTAPAVNPATDQFIFTAQDASGIPSLAVYSASAPFRQVGKISSGAPAGTMFDKVAVDPVKNIALAVNQQDSTVSVFDLKGGVELARIPFSPGGAGYGTSDVAINPFTSMAVITSAFTNRVTVVNLKTLLVTSEIPLPAGSRPLGVDIDTGLNRAVVTENGLSSNTRNGSVFVVQLPAQP
ncbi:MAG TPA: hypothetical protein VJX67_24765, partial [Blastocatellia bacterium]|nr:hypothetical protein [Blastocatellia bacterium]